MHGPPLHGVWPSSPTVWCTVVPLDPPSWCRGAEARSPHSVGGGECGRRAAELRRLDGGSQERRAATFQRFVIVDDRSTHGTSRGWTSVAEHQ